jgi:two-component system sensor histidine kinase YesM
MLWAFAFVLPILLLFLSSANTATRLYEKQIQANIRQMLTPFAREIDVALENAKRYIANKNINVYLQESGDELEKLSAVQSLGDSFSYDLSIYSQVDVIFLYDKRNLMFVQNYNSSYMQNHKAADYVTSFLKAHDASHSLFENGYISFEAGGDYFFLIAVDLPDGSVMGCWFNTDTLLRQVRGLNIDGLSVVLFADRTGNLMDEGFNTRSTRKLKELLSDFFVVNETLSSWTFSLTALFNRNIVMAPFVRLKRRIQGVSILTLALFGAYLALLKRAVIRPLNRLVRAIKDIEAGSLQAIPVGESECSEIRDVYRALNNMMSEVETLKISVYEEKLAQQNTQMHLFQLQIKPHFFMNALNTILSYARTMEYSRVQKMTLCLATHCRYILYNTWVVTVEEELAYTQNYIDMQNMQHERRCRYDAQVEEELYDLEIPFLAVQIFVENALKHNQNITSQIGITVSIEHSAHVSVSCLHVLIDDTGVGFDGDVLARLNNADPDMTGDERGIGIANVRQRLRILYGGSAHVIFSNRKSGGARVEMYLPLEWKRDRAKMK